MMPAQISRPALRLVQGAQIAPAEVEWTWFCGHCAAPAPTDEPPAPTARVCTSCGLGLLLETRRDTAPSADDAFLVIDNALLVQALSRRAQVLLGLTEAEAINRRVAELLVPADAEARPTAGFAAAIASAASGLEDSAIVTVRPWNTFGVRMRAKIAPCGPPRAALVVLEDPTSRPLRAVG
jgi:PAS domain-containing protein